MTKDTYTMQEFADRLEIAVPTLRSYRSRNKHGLGDIKRLMGNKFNAKEVEDARKRIFNLD